MRPLMVLGGGLIHPGNRPGTNRTAGSGRRQFLVIAAER